MKKHHWLLPLCSLFFLPTGSFGDAATGASQDHWLLAKYDLNGDTRITQNEISSKKLNIFRYMDGDQDGSVSLEEYQTMDATKRAALLKSRFYKLDEDQDGYITEAEYSNYMGLFESIDSDGDGVVTATEMGMDTSSAQTYVTTCVWRFCYRSELD